jgi:glutamate racemase
VKINPTTHKEEIHILVLATPFVINISQVYKHKLEEMHQQTHQGKGPTLVLHQIGPKNWVHNIETGADINEQHKEVKKEIDTYMNSLPSEQKGMISVAGLYCTHYPFYLPQIRDSLSEHSPDLKEIPYIQQGALFGDSLVDDIASEIAKGHIKERDTPLTREKASELFDGKVLSLSTGKNLEQTESALAQLNLLSEVSDIRPYPVD